MLNFIKKTMLILMSALLVFSLAACDDFDKRLDGFLEASAFMTDEPNLSSSTVIAFELSSGKNSVSFADFISSAIDIIGTGDFEEMQIFDIMIRLDSKIYENNMELTLYWIGPEKTEEVLHMIYADETLYIGTEILKTLEPFIADEMAVLSAMIGEAEYLSVELPSFADYPDEIASGFDLDFDLDMDFATLLPELKAEMNIILQKAFERLLTENPDEILQEKDGAYTLKLNTETALELAEAVLRAVTESDTETGFDLQENASSALDFISTDEFKDSIPAANFEYRVEALGENKQKTKNTALWLEIPAADVFDGTPFEKFEISVSETLKIQENPISAPNGVIFSIDELFGSISDIIIQDFDFDDFGFGDFGDFGFGSEDFDLSDFNLEQILPGLEAELEQFGLGDILGEIDMNDIESMLEGLNWEDIMGMMR